MINQNRIIIIITILIQTFFISNVYPLSKEDNLIVAMEIGELAKHNNPDPLFVFASKLKQSELLLKAGERELALKVYKEIISLCDNNNSIDIYLALNHMINNSNTDLAIKTFNSLKHKTESKTIGFYRKLIVESAKNNDENGVTNYLSMFAQNSNTACDSIVFKNGKHIKVSKSEIIYGAQINMAVDAMLAYLEVGDYRSANNIKDFLYAEELRKNQKESLCGKVCDRKYAVALWLSGFSDKGTLVIESTPDTEWKKFTYHEIAIGLGKKGQVEEAEQLLAKNKFQGLDSEAIKWGVIANARNGDTDTALNLLNKYRSRINLYDQVHIYSNIAIELSYKKRYDQAKQLLDDAEIAYMTAISNDEKFNYIRPVMPIEIGLAWGRIGEPERGIEFIIKNMETGVYPGKSREENINIYSKLIESQKSIYAVEHGDISVSRKILYEHTGNNKKYKGHGTIRLIRDYARAGDLIGAIEAAKHLNNKDMQLEVLFAISNI